MNRIMKEIKEIIEKKLKEQKIKKSDLATALGYKDVSGLSNALKRGTLKAAQLIIIAERLEVDIADLFPGNEKRNYLNMSLIDLIRTISKKEIENYLEKNKS